jgi:uncharacterized protein YjbI with pentapeptide repeats
MADEEKKELREISDEELEQILADSKLWVTSKGKEGKQADLSYTNLSGCHFEGAFLRGAHFDGALLWGVHLEGALLWSAHFKGADLTEAHLERAFLWSAHFEGADIKYANLGGADLSGAHFEGAILNGAHLSGARLSNAHLEGANLGLAQIEGANLNGAHLEGAELWAIHLEGADIRDAHLEGANLFEAILEGADLRSANLNGARLLGAQLQGADLRSANLNGARLLGAQLQGADLRSANLNGADVTGIKYDNEEKCRGLKTEKYRGINVDGCYGDDMFKRFAKDQAWLEQYLATRKTRLEKFRAHLWALTCGYGRNLGAWVFWAAYLMFIFAGIIFAMGPDHFKFPEVIKDPIFHPDINSYPTPPAAEGFMTSLYYSVVTFSTLGFGDITPKTGWGQMVVIVEVLLGYVMLGGLISILAERIARRA